MRTFYFYDGLSDSCFTVRAENYADAMVALRKEFSPYYVSQMISRISKVDYYTAHYSDMREFMWDTLLGNGISEQTLRVATNIAGYNEETLYAILYSEFGYTDFMNLFDND